MQCRMDLLGVCEVRWDKDSTAVTDDDTVNMKN
jgi:hypothetical protein